MIATAFSIAVFGLLQLTELLFAKRSPIAAAEELEDDSFLTAIARKRVRFASRVVERKIRSRVSNRDTRLAPANGTTNNNSRIVLRKVLSFSAHYSTANTRFV